jgi:hypothetical protein
MLVPLSPHTVKSLLLPLLAAGLLLVPGGAHGETMTPAYKAKVRADAHSVGVAPKGYVDNHGGRLPNSLEALPPVYLVNAQTYNNTILTTPNAVLSNLPEDCIIAVRTIPEDPNQVVAVYATIAAKTLWVSRRILTENLPG